MADDFAELYCADNNENALKRANAEQFADMGTDFLQEAQAVDFLKVTQDEDSEAANN